MNFNRFSATFHIFQTVETRIPPQIIARLGKTIANCANKTPISDEVPPPLTIFPSRLHSEQLQKLQILQIFCNLCEIYSDFNCVRGGHKSSFKPSDNLKGRSFTTSHGEFVPEFVEIPRGPRVGSRKPLSNFPTACHTFLHAFLALDPRSIYIFRVAFPFRDFCDSLGRERDCRFIEIEPRISDDAAPRWIHIGYMHVYRWADGVSRVGDRRDAGNTRCATPRTITR